MVFFLLYSGFWFLYSFDFFSRLFLSRIFLSEFFRDGSQDIVERFKTTDPSIDTTTTTTWCYKGCPAKGRYYYTTTDIFFLERNWRLVVCDQTLFCRRVDTKEQSKTPIVVERQTFLSFLIASRKLDILSLPSCFCIINTACSHHFLPGTVQVIVIFVEDLRYQTHTSTNTPYIKGNG